MSNHYHLVLFIHQEATKAWTQEDVIERWGKLFPSSAKNMQNLLAVSKSQFARQTYEDKIEAWRSHLSDISWFMRCLNESAARRANKEDNCKGRFWDRFLLLQNLHTSHPCE